MTASSPVVSPPPGPEARAAQLAADERAYARRRLRRLLLRVLGCTTSAAAGLGLMGLGMHLRDPGWAEIAFLSGLLVGNGGIFLTLLVAYQQAADDGEG